MPELPEVEVTRRGLAAPLLGATVQAVRLGKPLRWPLGIAPDALVGTRVGALQRRGKYIWMPLAPPGQPPGDPAGGVLLHLGMSGSLRLFEAPQGAALPAEVPAPGVHDHFEMETNHGTLRLNDPRRFGAVVWSAGLTTAPAATLLARLGVEPLEAGFTARQLHDALRGRRVAIKQALLAGDVVVGVGNIYCSEALFLAGIDPRTPAGELDMARCERLVVAVREVLMRALSAGGSTLRNFRDAHGMGGAFQTIAKVYDRAGEPCVACGTAIRRLVQGQRATYHCPTCQRR